MTFLTLLFLPVLGFADTGVTTQKLPPAMLFFVFGAVASMLFIKGKQDPGIHVGFVPIFQSIVIAVCFLASHYILLANGISLEDFYFNFVQHLDKSFPGFICVVLLDLGFVAVVVRTLGILLRKLKQL